ncbi:MAG TPA: hypothetical protein VFB94_22710, partial [Acidimicrobiales bacterium]|nr:hypothetical protein [Acidimicrobiales bacterium]
MGVLTGDTLFVGDVGRPDLMASVGFTPDALARRLYHSLHDQVLTLPDRTRDPQVSDVGLGRDEDAHQVRVPRRRSRASVRWAAEVTACTESQRTGSGSQRRERWPT